LPLLTPIKKNSGTRCETKVFVEAFFSLEGIYSGGDEPQIYFFFLEGAWDSGRRLPRCTFLSFGSLVD
jgi:hypothetical protein